MLIKKAVFEKSSTKISQCPETKLPEFAFIGRSNVGKSSLINMLTNIKGLAKTSASPGKTQLINHFLINETWYLVDLPGYGYAKISKETRAKWEKMIKDYLANRDNLLITFILIDSRIEPQPIDIELINWFGEKGLSFVVLFTKSDKKNQNEIAKNIKCFEKALLVYWEELPKMILTSAKTKKGLDEVLEIIDVVIK
jgi:GTP-binding protein